MAESLEEMLGFWRLDESEDWEWTGPLNPPITELWLVKGVDGFGLYWAGLHSSRSDALADLWRHSDATIDEAKQLGEWFASLPDPLALTSADVYLNLYPDGGQEP